MGGRGRTNARHTDSDRAAALAATVLSPDSANRAAAIAGVPRGSLDEWQRGRGIVPSVLVAGIQEGQKAGKRLAKLWEDVANDALRLIDARRLEKSSAAALATIAGIATDKRQMLLGEPSAVQQIQVQAQVADPMSRRLILEIERREAGLAPLSPFALSDERAPVAEAVAEGECREIDANGSETASQDST